MKNKHSRLSTSKAPTISFPFLYILVRDLKPIPISTGITAAMCMIRDNDDTCEKLLCRFQIRETINFPIDDLGETINFPIHDLEETINFSMHNLEETINSPLHELGETINPHIDDLEETMDFNMEQFMRNNGFPVEIIQRFAQFNYPYNLLPSSDEEEPVRGIISHAEDSTEDIHSTHDSSIEINQNANTPSASLNINFNISETHNTDQSREERTFELNIPEILLSMSRISHQLNILSSASHD
ncbi:hypothetical protein ACI65C_000661 [Semiaphis heraclei]